MVPGGSLGVACETTLLHDFVCVHSPNDVMSAMSLHVHPFVQLRGVHI
jgi:hypothetical protein